MNIVQQVQHFGRRVRDQAISALGAIKKDQVRAIDPTFDKRVDARVLTAAALKAKGQKKILTGQTMVKHGSTEVAEATRQEDAAKAWR